MFGEFTGFSLVTGVSVAVFSTVEVGFTPGAELGGGPLLFAGVKLSVKRVLELR